MDSPAAQQVSAESVSQAGAGALLLAVGVVEFALGFWAAGWWQRGGALLLAVVGAALLVRGVEAIAARSESTPTGTVFQSLVR